MGICGTSLAQRSGVQILFECLGVLRLKVFLNRAILILRRRFGLTVNDRGLYLRIPDIELLDRKKSLVFLTEKPSEVLEFIGLEEERWWRPFLDQAEMFNYAAGCRLFWVREKDEEEAEHDVVGEIPTEGGQEGGEPGKKKLKHNDRQRMLKRYGSQSILYISRGLRSFETFKNAQFQNHSRLDNTDFTSLQAHFQ